MITWVNVYDKVNNSCWFKLLNVYYIMIEGEDKKKLLSVSEYADINNVSVQSVYQKIWRKTLDFKKVGKTYLIEI